MSQTGYTPIQLYHSTTAAAAPSAGNLANGELALNITDGKLYYKDNGGAVQVLASKAGNVNVSSFSAGTTGFTPNTATTGAVTLAGTLATTNGGTGLTSFTANGVVYASSSSALTTGSALTFDGTTLTASASASATGNFKTTSNSAQVFNLTASNDANTTIGLGVFGSAAGSFGTLSAGIPFLSTAASTMVQNVQNASGVFVWGIGSTPAEQMRLTSTGLGIGTSSPSWRLVVNAASGGGMQFENSSDSNRGGRIIATGSAASGTFAVNTTSSGYALTFGIDGTERMRLDTSGNLGIGTSSPATQFVVSNAGAQGVEITGSNGAIQVYNRSTAAYGTMNLYANTLYFRTGASPAINMALDSSGNLGIGTSSPSQKLDVLGSIAVRASTSGANQDAVVLRALNSDNSAYANAIYYGNSQRWAYAGATEGMRLDSSGNLGIGTSSPLGKIDVRGTAYFNGTNAGSGASQLIAAFAASSGANFGQLINTGSTWSLGYGASYSSVGTSVLTWNSSGNLGLGVTPSASWDVTNSARALQFTGGALYSYSTTQMNYLQNAYYNGSNFIYLNTAAASAYRQISGAHSWYTAASGTAGNTITFTQAMTLDDVGRLNIGGTASTGAYRLAITGDSASYMGGIIFRQSSTDTLYLGNIAANNTTDFEMWNPRNGYIRFATNNIERARITSSGDLLVGLTGTAYNAERLTVYKSGNAESAAFVNEAGANNYTVAVSNRATTGDNKFMVFATESGDTTRGSISYNRAGGLVAYNTTSDYRAKDIIGPVQNPGATIDALKVYEGRMKGATQSRPMLVAHEAQEHTPYAVSGVKDEVNEDGTPKFQQMDVSSLVPLLLAELQSLRARVAQLESKGA